MTDLLEDLSKLTTIPRDALAKLAEKVNLIICDTVCEASTPITEVDLGIGTLLISNEQEQVKYKFIPSEKLDLSIREALDTKINPLQHQLEKRLVNKILHTYKDIL